MNQTSNLLQPQTDTTTAAPGGDPGSAGVHPNSDAALVVAITDHQQRLDDWAIVGQRKRFDLARAARVMHGWIKSLRTELIPPTWPGGGAIEHPPVLLTFSRLRRNVLGHFKPGRNEQSQASKRGPLRNATELVSAWARGHGTALGEVVSWVPHSEHTPLTFPVKSYPQCRQRPALFRPRRFTPDQASIRG